MPTMCPAMFWALRYNIKKKKIKLFSLLETIV